MNTLLAQTLSFPAADVETRYVVAPWARLRPLLSLLLVAFTLTALVGASLWVRIDVKRTLMEIDRNQTLTREARVLNERLHLEKAARTRAAALAPVAERFGLSPQANVVLAEEVP